MVDIMRIALTKSRTAWRASHQPVLIGSCLSISHACLQCLSSRWFESLCSTTLHDWTDGGSVHVFFNVEYGFISVGELMLFYGMGMEIKGKVMYYCFKEVK